MNMRQKLMGLVAATLIPVYSQAGSIGLDGMRDHDGFGGINVPGLQDDGGKGGILPPGWERNGGPSWLNRHGDSGKDWDKNGNHAHPNHDREYRGHGYHGVTTDTDRPGCNHNDGRDGTNPVPESTHTSILLGGTVIAFLGLGRRRLSGSQR